VPSKTVSVDDVHSVSPASFGRLAWMRRDCSSRSEASSSFIFSTSKLASSGITMICANGSFARKMCLRPSAGALNTQKNTIGHQLRINAGTATGIVSLRSV
jgi:hypothetical protein